MRPPEHTRTGNLSGALSTLVGALAFPLASGRAWPTWMGCPRPEAGPGHETPVLGRPHPVLGSWRLVDDSETLRPFLEPAPPQPRPVLVRHEPVRHRVEPGSGVVGIDLVETPPGDREHLGNDVSHRLLRNPVADEADQFSHVGVADGLEAFLPSLPSSPHHGRVMPARNRHVDAGTGGHLR